MVDEVHMTMETDSGRRKYVMLLTQGKTILENDTVNLILTLPNYQTIRIPDSSIHADLLEALRIRTSANNMRIEADLLCHDLSVLSYNIHASASHLMLSGCFTCSMLKI